MKVKFHFQTTEATVTVPPTNTSKITAVNIPAIHVEGEVECSVAELRELWELKKDVLTELPDVLNDCKTKLETMFVKKEEVATPDTEKQED